MAKPSVSQASHSLHRPPYDGTNAGVGAGIGRFVFDTTQQTLDFDDDSSDPSYTALATASGASVVATDIDVFTTTNAAGGT